MLSRCRINYYLIFILAHVYFAFKCLNNLKISKTQTLRSIYVFRIYESKLSHTICHSV